VLFRSLALILLKKRKIRVFRDLAEPDFFAAIAPEFADRLYRFKKSIACNVFSNRFVTA
jgi:hypothetical protein